MEGRRLPGGRGLLGGRGGGLGGRGLLTGTKITGVEGGEDGRGFGRRGMRDGSGATNILFLLLSYKLVAGAKTNETNANPDIKNKILRKQK